MAASTRRAGCLELSAVLQKRGATDWCSDGSEIASHSPFSSRTPSKGFTLYTNSLPWAAGPGHGGSETSSSLGPQSTTPRRMTGWYKIGRDPRDRILPDMLRSDVRLYGRPSTLLAVFDLLSTILRH